MIYYLYMNKSEAAKLRLSTLGPDYMSRLAKKRHEKMTKEERTALAIKLSNLRWKKSTVSNVENTSTQEQAS